MLDYVFVFHSQKMDLRLCVFFTVIVNSSGGDTPSSYWDENYSQPYFDNSTKRDITVTIGQTAVLHCRVRNLGDRAVSLCGMILKNLKLRGI